MPKVSVWQLDYDATNGVLAAGTHGRGAYTLTNSTPRPALVVSKVDAGTPVGPGSTIHYTITVRNIGNAAATGVSVTDPVPAHTTVTSVGSGGHVNGRTIHWNGKSIPAGGQHLADLRRPHRPAPRQVGQAHHRTTGSWSGITLGIATTGSPHTTADRAGARRQRDAEVGRSRAPRTDTVRPSSSASPTSGYQTDSYAVAASGGAWHAAVYDSTCTDPLATTGAVTAGASVDVCVKVDVPDDAADNATNDTTFTATSDAVPVGVGLGVATRRSRWRSDTLLVDNDTNDPVDSAPYYQDALDANGVDYSTWDLADSPEIPQSYLTAHTNVVWFTGQQLPGDRSDRTSRSSRPSSTVADGC